MDPVALKIQALMPMPQNANATLNYLSVYPYPADQAIPSIKVDHNFNQSNFVSGRYYYGNSIQDFPLALTGGGILPGFDTNTPTRGMLCQPVIPRPRRTSAVWKNSSNAVGVRFAP